MLRRAHDMLGCVLHARDGEIGRVKDVYFDDKEWVVRYLVADTNKWLPGRRVLLSPLSVKRADEAARIVDIDLMRQQIKDSPSIDEHMPVSRQFETAYFKYYEWPMYWREGGPEGTSSPPMTGYASPGESPEPEKKVEPHLRALKEITGYHLHAVDGEIGHVEDMAFDTADWAIRYLMIGTKNWWPARKVAISVEWVGYISFDRSEVSVDLGREMIRQAPEFDASIPISREYEEKLFAYYQRPPYWSHEKRLAA